MPSICNLRQQKIKNIHGWQIKMLKIGTTVQQASRLPWLLADGGTF